MPKTPLQGNSRERPFELARARLLTPRFFARDPRRVARELLGKLLVRREGERLRAGRLVEVEAYLGQDDAAAHAAAGETPRNRVLFGPPGRAYVYLIYGNHFCLNVSCLPEGQAGCVLIRSLEPLLGLEEMAPGRGLELSLATTPTRLRLLASGPGRLTQAFAITRPRDNGTDMTSPASDLVLMDDGFRPRKIALTPRIGITKSAATLLRYVVVGSPFVSGKRVVTR